MMAVTTPIPQLPTHTTPPDCTDTASTTVTINNKQVDVNAAGGDINTKICGNASEETVNFAIEVGGPGLAGGASLTWSAAPAEGVVCNVPATVSNATELSVTCSGFPDDTDVAITFTLTKDGAWAGDRRMQGAWCTCNKHSLAGSKHLAPGRVCTAVGCALSLLAPHACIQHASTAA